MVNSRTNAGESVIYPLYDVDYPLSHPVGLLNQSLLAEKGGLMDCPSPVGETSDPKPIISEGHPDSLKPLTQIRTLFVSYSTSD